MVFSSSLFILYFLPLFLLAYHFVDRRYKNYLILLASLFFYSWGAPKFIFVIVGATLADFYLVKQMHKSNQQSSKKILLGLSVFIKLGLLAYFKYANFFVENLNQVLQLAGFNNISWTSVALPIGISFYTFQSITYSIDVYRKVHKPLKKASDYLLYIMMFPQMIAGPIVRFNTIADQIINRKETIDDKLAGFYRFSIGLAKKVLIANVMAEQADLIFNGDLSNLSMINAWLGALAYTFQIYFDFAGYSDMAIGLGKMMGFRFPENFNSPYVSKSISEFWRRWHITLGAFMRDYLYIPLGGNRVKRSRMFFNLWIVFLLSGLWHGASWNFVLWGAFHGLFLVLDRLFLLDWLKRIGKLPATLFTFVMVVLGWVIFRIEELDRIKLFFKGMLSFDFASDVNTISAFPIIAAIAVLFSFISYFSKGEQLGEFFFNTKSYSIKNHIVLSAIAASLLILSIASITSSGFNPFIYFRF
ncbi:MBOAT family protein [Prolixibacteraceae bacterium JC049]|nr:MBOAT family protein [Prolixibacteraceae bacterium JC049]